ncbi:cell division protein ZipA [Shewanella gelidimarina]|uniref:cell division protein ZipA n=1 Tax=Shewanella gelidimarina TaxID=56813 RepID=UPI00200BD5FF|nr:cell division protein ZipA [Shewanella gelidimarina]MCL1059856.1 cell division protein ZipA [Shewanella gelidimarina]
MENLRLVLLLLGAIVIIAVLVHGFWSIKKQQPKGFKQSPMTDINRERRDSQGFDNDGIGEVRIIKAQSDQSSVTEQSIEPLMAEAGATANVDTVFESNVDTTFSLTEAPTQKAARAAKTTRVEPSLSEAEPDPDVFKEDTPIQPSLFGADEPVLSTEAAQESFVAESVEEPQPLGEPQDVLVLHVVAKEGEELNGAELLPCLLTLNFKFGEMNIFHRHEDNAGTGKVLFSMANMVKPGVFDPDSMEQFSTQGVVLFMTLPCHGDALRNFSIMLNSAHQIADDLNGIVLDGGRDAWLDSTKQNYIQRIKAQV